MNNDVSAAWSVGDTISITVASGAAIENVISRNGLGFVEAFSPGTVTYTITAADTLTPFGFGISSNTTSIFMFACTPGTPSNSDSQNLRSLQIAATNTVATNSGAAITGAINDSIAGAFNNGAAPVTPSPNGLFLNFAAEPQRDAATQEAIDALAYAGGAGIVTKAPPPAPLIHSDWSVWADVRGTGFNQNNAGGSSHEEQINVTGGIGRKLSPNLLVGLFTGYENFSDTIESLAGKLTGSGGTIGTYAAWHYADHWRVDGMFGWSDVFYNATAGTAAGSFHGSRWLGSGGLTGNYNWAGFMLEPSARIYTLWESENAFTDNLGTAQAARSFSASRFSVGEKVSYPWPVSSSLNVVPYLGFYTDYHFSTDNALPVGVPFVGIQNGWSGRVTAGATLATAHGGPSLSLGGELGGLGAGYELWSANAKVTWPF